MKECRYYILMGMMPSYERRLRGGRVTGTSRMDKIKSRRIFAIRDRVTLYLLRWKTVPIGLTTIVYRKKKSKRRKSVIVKGGEVYHSYIIKCKSDYDSIKFLESLKGILSLDSHDDSLLLPIYLMPLTRRPLLNGTDFSDLYNSLSEEDMMGELEFYSELLRGHGTGTISLIDYGNAIRCAFFDKSIRKALTSFYEAQQIFYTSMMPGTVEYDIIPSITDSNRRDYHYRNLLFQERIALAHLSNFRGLEALYKKRIREGDFTDSNKKSVLAAHIDSITPHTRSNDLYSPIVYGQRRKKPIKNIKIISLLWQMNKARHIAAHGHPWANRKTLSMELIHESTYFFAYILKNKLPQFDS